MRTADGSRLVTQSDHARLAAEILRLFRLPELVGHPRRELLLRAVSEHDNGWWEADSAPRRDASATSALDFRAFPVDLQQEIWQRGVERFATASPYVGALLTAHALRLSRHRQEVRAGDGFVEALTRRQLDLLAAAGEDLESIAHDDPWLALADGISLAVCTGDSGFVDLPGWRGEVGWTDGGADGTTIDFGLQPFPLAGTTSFELSCRWLEESLFASDAALGAALLAAPWKRLRVRVQPL